MTLTTIHLFAVSILACAVLLQHAVPYLHGAALFGVPVRSEVRHGQAGRAIIRRYTRQLLPWTILAIGLVVTLPSRWAIAAAAISGLATIRMYGRAHRDAERWRVEGDGVRAAALADAGDDLRRVLLRFLPPLGALTVTSIYLWSQWDQIPARFVVHWTAGGIPNGWVTKTAPHVFGPLAIAASIIVFLAGLGSAVLWGSSRRSPTGIVLSLLTAMAYFVTTTFIMIAVLARRRLAPVVLIITVAAYVGVIGRIIWQTVSAAPDATTPPECWRAGQFYVNASDAAVFVPTPVGRFLTLNLGNAAAWFLLACSGAYILAVILLARVIWGT